MEGKILVGEYFDLAVLIGGKGKLSNSKRRVSRRAKDELLTIADIGYRKGHSSPFSF